MLCWIYAVLDTAAGAWLDRTGVVTSSRSGRYSADSPGGEASAELTRRCRHTAASVGNSIYIYGGLRAGKWISLYIVSKTCNLYCSFTLFAP
jgi:hypothetical protein